MSKRLSFFRYFYRVSDSSVLNTNVSASNVDKISQRKTVEASGEKGSIMENSPAFKKKSNAHVGYVASET